MFEETFESTEWRKVKQMQPMRCDYASIKAGALRRHLIRHSGEKSNKCNQCAYVSNEAGDLRTHMKNTVVKNQTDATNATLHPLRQAI